MNLLFKHTSQHLDNLYQSLGILDDPQNNRSVLDNLLEHAVKLRQKENAKMDESKETI